MSITVMKLALDALEYEAKRGGDGAYLLEREALRQAITEAEKQAVAWMGVDSEGNPNKFRLNPFGGGVPLYTTPPAQREWQGLTDEEVMSVAYRAGFEIHEDYDAPDADPNKLHWWSPDYEPCDDALFKLRDLIEAKLKEKNI